MSGVFNYLGINLDRKLDYGLVITEIGKKVINRGFALRRMFYRYPRTRWRIRGMLFKTCVRSLVMYAAPMLMTATRAQWNRIESAETVALRAMFRRNDNYGGLLERAQVQPVHQEYSNLSNRFATRLDQSGYADLLVVLDME